VSWETLTVIGAQVITAVATIAALRTDVAWLKRWAREHSRSDEHEFSRVHKRIDALEARRS
jgi:FtsZ-binding cell division protein ZapB